jgi:hypothetical protein
VFSGTIDGTRLAAAIQPIRRGRFIFIAAGTRAELTGEANPVRLSLAIGNDSSATSVIARFK